MMRMEERIRQVSRLVNQQCVLKDRLRDALTRGETKSHQADCPGIARL